MSNNSDQRTLEEVKASLRDRLAGNKAPFHAADKAAAAEGIEALTGLQGEAWTAPWVAAGNKYRQQAEAHEAAGRLDEAGDAYFKAYGLYHVGRYPVPSHPAKMEAYRLSRECFQRAGLLMKPKKELISVPFAGRPGEGDKVIFYARRRPASEKKQPVVIRWSGIDTWKEERQDIDERLFKAGLAVITMDMPGTGESPVLVGPEGERQFVPVLDWIAAQPELDAKRVGIIGMSWGGYWATKLAFMHADRLAAAVNWAGPVHHSFKREWLLKSRNAGSYLMDITIARSRCVGKTDYESYIEAASKLSLLDAGLLDKPHPPMLLVNGNDDRQQSLEDFMLLVETGKPKAMRLFPGGHMGYPKSGPTVVEWISSTLNAEPPAA
ncbi:MAG: alpha/beta hydrolase [Steroidobacteraceae bacterium]